MKNFFLLWLIFTLGVFAGYINSYASYFIAMTAIIIVLNCEKKLNTLDDLKNKEKCENNCN